MFNSREQALIIWMIILLLYALSVRGVRFSIPKILKALVGLLKHPIFIFANIYIVIVFIYMYSFDVLERDVTKDYVVWIFLSLYPLIFKISTKYMELSIRSIIKETFKLSIVPIFIINEYTLSLWVEIIIVPILFIIVGILAVTEAEGKYNLIRKLLNSIMVFIGLIFVITATIGLTNNYEDANSLDFWQKMFFDIIGIMLHLPLLFLLRYMCFYEQILVRTNFGKRSQKLGALLLIFNKYRFDTDSLKKLVKFYKLRNIKSLEELKRWLDAE
ncbi:hypothetical protein [Paenibacillus sp. FSL R5-0519]|uniref:hypothetical protein n=1 Tax=Paenibacillus sp. FSL R5-0519 TaxID=2921648 RepID=UPI0030DB6501